MAYMLARLSAEVARSAPSDPPPRWPAPSACGNVGSPVNLAGT
jgi:hypothetical protein